MRGTLIILTATISLSAACGEATDGSASAAEQTGDTGAVVTLDTTTGGSVTETTVAETAEEPAATAAATTEPAVELDPTTTVLAARSGSEEQSQLLAALAETGDVTSARIEGWITIVGGASRSAGTSETMKFSGAFDTASQASMSLFDFSQFAVGMPGTANLSPAMAEAVGELELRTIGDTAYMRLGLLASFGFPTPWVSMLAADLSELADGFGVDTADPRGALGVFALAEADVAEIGRERIRGVDTTHFRISADVADMLALADPAAADQLRAIEGFPSQGALPIDMWIGDDGLVRRLSYTVNDTADLQPEFESLELGWEIFDYGVPIDVSAPPADQVTDGAALLEMASGV